MKKKQLLNIGMVLTIILAFVIGIFAVGHVKGWFGKEETRSDLTISEKSGIVKMERSGISYEVEQGIAVENGDSLYTETAASLTIAKVDKPIIYMGANTEVSIIEAEDALIIEVLKGNPLFDTRGLEQVTVVTGEREVEIGQAVAAISTQTGSSMIYVYAGEAELAGNKIAAGNVATVIENSDECKISNLKAKDLSDEQISHLKQCGMDESFCFTEKELDQVLETRAQEKLEAQKEALKKKEEKEEEPEEETVEAEPADEETVEAEPEDEEYEEEDFDDESYEEVTDTPEEEIYEEEYEEPEYQYCSITIVCDTILNNWDNLESGKEGYVPDNGVILGTSTVEFYEGETVFDVLQRVCDGTGIQLEYSYTPIYESYYIEGINQIYEFDCGPESGWMYQVNGWFPNYGCSSYQLEDGDSIVWCYSCNGLGADVGGSNF